VHQFSFRLKKVIFIFILSLLSSFFDNAVYAQESPKSHWIYFKDKGNEAFDPYTFFDALAIERRKLNNIDLYNEQDKPVSGGYLSQIEQLSDSVIAISRWLNAAILYTDAERLMMIQQLRFVDHTEPYFRNSSLQLASMENVGAEADDEPSGKERKNQILENQIGMMYPQAYKSKGISGKGVRVAVFDAGFPGVDVHPAFEHIRQRNGILMTYDFVKRSKKVYHANFHGTAVLSCIAGIKDGIPMGLATDAEFLLARTERALIEPYSEEVNWLMAAEWADKNGAHIISSSLGYGNHRYFYRDMDGKKSLVSRAAGMAARRGVLILNSAGNEATDSWRFLITPSDNDSVVCVGGVDPFTLYHISFSSFGPSYSGSIKPNISASGTALCAVQKGYRLLDGTSFACPLASGFAACMLQYKPELKGKPLEAMRTLEANSSLYPFYDYAHGFGVPDARKITGDFLEPRVSTFDVIKTDTGLKIAAMPMDMSEINPQANLVFMHLRDASDRLIWYKTFQLVNDNSEIFIHQSELSQGKTLMVSHRYFHQLIPIE
jgi:serine protease AprX